jgi:hypothetical protein
MKHDKHCYHLNESIYHTFSNVASDGVSFDSK